MAMATLDKAHLWSVNSNHHSELGHNVPCRFLGRDPHFKRTGVKDIDLQIKNIKKHSFFHFYKKDIIKNLHKKH